MGYEFSYPPSPNGGGGTYTNTRIFPHSKNICLVLKNFETFSAIKISLKILLYCRKKSVYNQNDYRTKTKTRKKKMSHLKTDRLHTSLSNKEQNHHKRITKINKFRRPLKTPSKPYLGRTVYFDSRLKHGLRYVTNIKCVLEKISETSPTSSRICPSKKIQTLVDWPRQTL